jgi:3-hydroxyacyl-CoA dehydrogenase
VTIATHVATVLCGGASHAGGPVSESRILELEREAFVSLSGEPKTQERMAHMLAHKTALRN